MICSTLFQWHKPSKRYTVCYTHTHNMRTVFTPDSLAVMKLRFADSPILTCTSWGIHSSSSQPAIEFASLDPSSSWSVRLSRRSSSTAIFNPCLILEWVIRLVRLLLGPSEFTTKPEEFGRNRAMRAKIVQIIIIGCNLWRVIVTDN